jgi:hypothetical protein
MGYDDLQRLTRVAPCVAGGEVVLLTFVVLLGAAAPNTNAAHLDAPVFAARESIDARLRARLPGGAPHSGEHIGTVRFAEAPGPTRLRQLEAHGVRVARHAYGIAHVGDFYGV